MKTKDRLLQLFENNKGSYLSGEEIASYLEVSRTAVWKAVNKLKEEGYKIEAITNKGYCLLEGTDIISKNGIISNLKDEYKKIDIEVFNELSSTNDYLKSLDVYHLNDEHLIISNYQTKGRGRYGNTFFSPKNSGIYMSMLLKPNDCYSSKAMRLTTMAAVSMCEAIEEVTDLKPLIKWVNDIFVNGKKVCGILTEAQFGLESGLLEYAILGIGINIYKPDNDFPNELKEIAGFLLDEVNDEFKNKLIASFINHFNYYYYGNNHDYTEKYRKYSLVIGKNVTVLINNHEEEVKVLGIDDDCKLIIEYPNKEVKTLAYGEIKIKL